jgi:hypothetical protein
MQEKHGLRVETSSCGIRAGGWFMTRMMMMWLFGVPLSVTLLFMFFGII